MKTGSWDFIKGWAPGKLTDCEVCCFLGRPRDMRKKITNIADLFCGKKQIQCICVDYGENTLDYAEISTAKKCPNNSETKVLQGLTHNLSS